MAGLICAGCWVARPSGTPGPSITDWITAAATVGALLAASAAAIIAWRVHVHNQSERRAEQASRIGAWVEWREDLPRPVQLQRFATNAPGYGCTLLNASTLPVYDLVIVYRLVNGSQKIEAGSAPVKLLAPGEKVLSTPKHVRDEVKRLAGNRLTLRAEIRFTDSAGRRWWRAHNGVLIDKGPWKPAPLDPETEDGQGYDPQH